MSSQGLLDLACEEDSEMGTSYVGSTFCSSQASEIRCIVGAFWVLAGQFLDWQFDTPPVARSTLTVSIE